MIRPAEYDILDTQGVITNTDYTQPITLYDGVGTPIDLTTWKGRMQVKLSPSDPAIITFDSEQGTMILGDSVNNITLKLTRQQTDVPAGRYLYDMRLQNDEIEEQQNIYIRGRFDIIANITDTIT